MTYCRSTFEAQLIEDGQTEQLAAFRAAADKLVRNSAEEAVFTFDAYCAYHDLPNNDGSGKWSEYCRTGVWNGKKRF
jgi:hypothetical protein